MSSFNYQNSTITKYRAGTSSDPYIDITESKKVINSVIQLNEIPVSLNKVRITGYYELPTSSTSDLAANEYRVDYAEGLVYFNVAAEGLTLTAIYKGRGNHFVSVNRIWTENDGLDVIQTLGDIIDAGQQVIDELPTLNQTIDDAHEATADANTAAANADAKAALAVTATTNANTATSSANTATGLANTAASQANTARDSANTAASAANTAKTNADAATSLANTAASNADDSADNADLKAAYALEQGDYAKAKGDYAAELSNKGEYDNGATYKPLNIVVYNDTVYQNILQSTGVLPTNTTYWKMIMQLSVSTTWNSVINKVDASITEKGIVQLIDNASTPSTTLAPTANALKVVNDTLSAQLADITLNVKMFGAIGDGIHDDTTAIQSCIDYAATIGAFVLFPPGVYKTSTIYVKNGVRGLTSNSAVLLSTASFGKVISCTTDNLDLLQQVNNCTIKGFEINLDQVASIGIYLYGSDNEICNCHIYGARTGSQLVRVTYDSHRNRVHHNRLISAIDEPFATYTDMSCVIVEGKQYNNAAGLDVSDEVIMGTNTSYDNQVYNNYLVGGTHTIGLRQAERTLISQNTITKGSHRGIVLSPAANNNLIDNNFFLDCGSSSVHMAYGSSDNFVTNNRIYNNLNPAIDGLTGEGEIQSYVHAKNNTISGNDITTRKRYGIYVAINADGVIVKSNTVRGGLVASIGVESEWQTPLPTGASYARPNYAPTTNPSWASWDNGKGLSNVIVSDNTVFPYLDGSTTCGIYVGQALSGLVDGLIVTNNKIVGKLDFGTDLYVFVNDPTRFTNVIISNNVNIPNQPLRNVFTNPNTKLTNYRNNSWNTQTITITAARIDASNLIDVSIYDNYFVTATPSTIAGFKGVVAEGRELTVRLNPNITLIHSTAFRLKGNANVTTPNTASDNLIMKFVYIGGSWIESMRNF